MAGCEVGFESAQCKLTYCDDEAARAGAHEREWSRGEGVSIGWRGACEAVRCLVAGCEAGFRPVQAYSLRRRGRKSRGTQARVEQG